jgi:hypothetical protein
MRPKRKISASENFHNTILANKTFIEKSRKLLHRYDPIGLKPCPEDEYEPERASISRHLKKCRSAKAVTALVHREFVHWFGAKQAGPAENYDALSAELFTLYKTFSSKPRP